MTLEEGSGISYPLMFLNKSVSQLTYHIRQLEKIKVPLTDNELVKNSYKVMQLVITAKYTLVQQFLRLSIKILALPAG